jgi:diguanylate cyclase (GGDEF)-like protein
VTAVQGPVGLVRATQVAAVAGLGAYAAQAAVAVCGSAADGFFETWVYTGLLLVAAALCLSRGFLVQRERAAWLILGIGVLAWAGGEIYWSAFLSDVAEPALPNGADVLWFAFFPCCYVAMVLLVRARVREFRPSLWLDGIVGSLAIAAVGTALVFGALSAGGGAEVTLDLAYLLADLLLLGCVISVFALTGWRPGATWALLGGGLAMAAIVDGFFMYLDATGGSVDSTLVATLWPASALMIGAAAWQETPGRRPLRIEGLRVVALPALFATAALGVLVYHAIDPVNTPALSFAVATLGAVIVRMALTYRENLKLLEGTRHEAMTDALTGLSNRRRLLADLEEMIGRASSRQPCALIMFDLDGFKAYNDRFGHPVGDALLARLGHNLAETVAGAGRGYRLGGDEFCVVACGDREALSALAGRAHAALRDSGRGFEITSSFGMVLVPDEAPDTEHALNLADERLYEHKGESRRTTVTKETSDALVAVLKECQPELDGHLSEVARLARDVAARMGMRPGELEEVTRAAQLHDIGKVAVPSDILDKHGPLDEAEWDFVRQHTLVGDRILSAAPAMSSVAEVVRASHERFDGAGYPDGLAGDSIPLGARIVAVCDAYHAMTGGRPYRAAVGPDDALHELRRCSGAQFDPEVVDSFCGLLSPAPS